MKLIERLEEARKRGPHIENDWNLYGEAKAEIERLQTELAELRLGKVEAIKRALTVSGYPPDYWNGVPD